jgi:hypothetical protein
MVGPVPPFIGPQREESRRMLADGVLRIEAVGFGSE